MVDTIMQLSAEAATIVYSAVCFSLLPASSVSCLFFLSSAQLLHPGPTPGSTHSIPVTAPYVFARPRLTRIPTGAESWYLLPVVRSLDKPLPHDPQGQWRLKILQ